MTVTTPNTPIMYDPQCMIIHSFSSRPIAIALACTLHIDLLKKKPQSQENQYIKLGRVETVIHKAKENKWLDMTRMLGKVGLALRIHFEPNTETPTMSIVKTSILAF